MSIFIYNTISHTFSDFCVFWNFAPTWDSMILVNLESKYVDKTIYFGIVPSFSFSVEKKLGFYLAGLQNYKTLLIPSPD